MQDTNNREDLGVGHKRTLYFLHSFFVNLKLL